MSNPPDKNRPSAPPESEVLANIPEGAADHELQTSASDEPLKRPRGALVAMRKSGGIRFTWRLLVVRGDGRLIYKSNQIGAPRAPRAIGRLDAAQLADLQALIAQADFAASSPGAARQNPDAFAYELIARVGRKNVFAEVFEGSIPDGLKPLIQRLNRLLPAHDSSSEPAADDQ